MPVAATSDHERLKRAMHFARVSNRAFPLLLDDGFTSRKLMFSPKGTSH